MSNIPNVLATKAKELQINTLPLVSFGKENKTNNFVDEAAKAIDFGFEIVNDSDSPVFIAIGGYDDTLNRTIFDDKNDLLKFLGADCFIGDGIILSRTPGVNTSGNVTVTTTDSKRKMRELIRYAVTSPFRFTKFSMRSSTITGAPESTNYNTKYKSFWITPLEDTVSQDLNINALQVGGQNFNTNMLDVDFITQSGSFKSTVSNENFFVIQVNARTVLNISAGVGAQLSTAQLFHRMASRADEVMAPVRRALNA